MLVAAVYKYILHIVIPLLQTQLKLRFYLSNQMKRCEVQHNIGYSKFNQCFLIINCTQHFLAFK